MEKKNNIGSEVALKRAAIDSPDKKLISLCSYFKHRATEAYEGVG